MSSSANGNLRGGRTVCNIPVRVLISEDHKLKQKLTQFGIENGANVSDHVVESPNEVNITFEMTNTDGGREEAKKSFLQFVQLMQSKEVVNIYTEHATYRNMVCTSFDPSHSAPNLGAYRATATLSQAGITDTQGRVTESQAQGGRSESDLAGSPRQTLSSESSPKNREVLYRTAVAPQNGGLVRTIDNPALDKKILKTLKSYSDGTYKPSRRK